MYFPQNPMVPGYSSFDLPQWGQNGVGMQQATQQTGVNPIDLGNQGLTAMNIGSLAIGGLQTLGGLYNAFQAQKLANRQFRFNRDFSLANYGNSVQSYNTRLEDRVRARAHMEGKGDGYISSYLNKNSLNDDLNKKYAK